MFFWMCAPALKVLSLGGWVEYPAKAASTSCSLGLRRTGRLDYLEDTDGREPCVPPSLAV